MEIKEVDLSIGDADEIMEFVITLENNEKIKIKSSGVIYEEIWKDLNSGIIKSDKDLMDRLMVHSL